MGNIVPCCEAAADINLRARFLSPPRAGLNKKPNENKYNRTANALAFLPLAAQRHTPTAPNLQLGAPFLMKLAASLGES
jgi:hypothetical protein